MDVGDMREVAGVRTGRSSFHALSVSGDGLLAYISSRSNETFFRGTRRMGVNWDTRQLQDAYYFAPRRLDVLLGTGVKSTMSSVTGPLL